MFRYLLKWFVDYLYVELIVYLIQIFPLRFDDDDDDDGDKRTVYLQEDVVYFFILTYYHLPHWKQS